MDMFSELNSASSKARENPFRLSLAKRRTAMWGLFFISPWLIGFLIFYLAPMIVSLIFSLYRFELSAPDEAAFIGLDNWRRLLFEDPQTWQALRVTLVFAVISLPIGMLSAFMLAVLLNSKNLIGRDLFRTLFYAPTMVPLIAAILIWAQVLNPQTGWINRMIESVGISATGANGIRWLDDPSLIYISYTLIGIWGIGNAILINMAALQGVPTALYEAAEIDGAGWTRKLWNITIPMVTPVIFYNLVISVVGMMQYFIVPWVLNGGDGYPEGTTRFMMIQFYQQAFSFQNMGYGSTIAWFIFIVALAITIFLFATGRYWVYYAGENN
ncbi:MAG: sugar ABC transporter permease [Phototrophicaceae bacterium]